MRKYSLAVLYLSTVAACTDWVPLTDGGSSPSDQTCPRLPDLAPSSPKCAAAKGLPGDNVFCVDFSALPDQTLTTPPPAPLAQWDFEKFDKSCWQILNGKLQVKNFSTFMSSCGFLMPTFNLNDADKQKYNSVTLSVLQRIDLVPSQQTAQVSLGSPLPARTFWSTTGKTEHQQLMIAMARTDPVPTAASEGYQYLFQMVSGAMAGSLQGWQIESIAVNASP